MSSRRNKKSDEKRDERSLLPGSHRIEWSTADKVFFPDDKITKGNAIACYRGVTKHVLPAAPKRRVRAITAERAD